MSNYDNKQDASRISEMFKALSNPNRLRIFLAMARTCGPGEQNLDDEGVLRCTGDLCKNVEIAPSTLSHHIKELRRAGLIQVERKGKIIVCSVNRDALRMLGAFFDLQTGS
jgi:ArsR family transcriptional regulator